MILTIPGYDYGTARAARSPVTCDELRELEATVGWTSADDDAIAMAGEVLAGQEEAMVDAWRARIGKHPHLAKWFFRPDGRPDEASKAAVKKRFVQWVRDTCARRRDQQWLDYQEEIGLRHTPAKKNKTEGAHTPDVVPLRHLLAFAGPAILDARPFFAKNGHSAAVLVEEDVGVEHELAPLPRRSPAVRHRDSRSGGGCATGDPRPRPSRCRAGPTRISRSAWRSSR